MPSLVSYPSRASAFLGGIKAALTSVFTVVLAGTYVGVGALAHDFGFSAWWLALSTVLVWAAPAQVILISTLGAGAPLIEVAITVTLSAVRLFPMVVSLLPLLPLLRGERRRIGHLLLPAHFTAVSMWVESLRLLPGLAHEHRLAFCNGLAVAYMTTAVVFGSIGVFLAASLPPMLAAMLLFLTPVSFLISTARNARLTMDWLALAFGLCIAPLLAYLHVGLDLFWTGVIGGSLAYAVNRLRKVVR